MKVSTAEECVDVDGQPFLRMAAPHVKVTGHRHPVIVWTDKRCDDPAGLLDPMGNLRAVAAVCGAREFGRALFPGIPAGARNTEWAPDYVSPLKALLAPVLARIPTERSAGIDWYSGRHTAPACWSVEGAFIQTQGNGSGADGRDIPGTYGSPVPARAAVGARAALRDLDEVSRPEARTRVNRKAAAASRHAKEALRQAAVAGLSPPRAPPGGGSPDDPESEAPTREAAEEVAAIPRRASKRLREEGAGGAPTTPGGEEAAPGAARARRGADRGQVLTPRPGGPRSSRRIARLATQQLLDYHRHNPRVAHTVCATQGRGVPESPNERAGLRAGSGSGGRIP